MKKLLLISGALAALIGPATAADLARPVYRRPVVVAAPVYSWTGFYVGGNVGGSWGNSSNTWGFFANNTCPPAAGLCVTGSDSNHLKGAIGGLQAGYNWQAANYVFGVETDIEISGQKGDQVFNGIQGANGPATAAPLSAPYTEKLPWLGTVRGRVGFTFDRLLIYAPGGLAYGRVTANGSATIAGCGGICPFASWSTADTRTGWTLGAGVEGALAGNWSWKIEYLHVDLGNVSPTLATLPAGVGGPGGALLVVNAGAGTISSRITDEIVRVGLNYKFGYAAAPIGVYK
jgi:outer membrane immunogenic protein